ncbi:hypothetical protein ACROYT_G026640 [Oculina patagonica]
MAQNSPTGPIRLEKPRGVIKLKIKKKKSSQNPSFRISNALKPINGPIQDGRSQALKRANPFRCSPRKKPNLTADAKTSECRLFNVLDGLDENLENVTANKLQPTASIVQENANKKIFDASDGEASERGEVETPIDEIEASTTFPLDWSLKSKVRFTSSTSFNWCGTLKTQDEGEGLSNFVRCQTKEFDLTDRSRENSIDGYPSSFCSFTKVWMHPSLPWAELFPRKSSEGRGTSKKGIQLTDEMSSSLHRDWVFSFRSVFNLVRAGFCPYFYLVANQNTMLFQAAEINRNESVQVLITPTTKGFRDALRNEGIHFTMPHLEDRGKKEPGSESQDDDSDDEDDLEPADDSDDEHGDKREWLESMGLDKEQFPLLKPKAVTPHQRNNLRTIDQQPTSTVLVKGADTHALFNFLLNCKSLTANTGPQAQVPPTLLAPVAFDGATLKSLRVNQGVLKHQQAKGMKQLYSLEISGPLLPGFTYELCHLLKASQKGNFKATFSAHQPSVAFNVPNHEIENNYIASDCYLERSISSGQWKHYQEVEQLKGNCLKELNCKDGLFTWAS